MSDTKQKIIYVIYALVLILTAINIYLIKTIQKKEVKPDPVQYYGQVISIKLENNQKIICVKSASTPYPKYDNNLEGEVELIASESLDIQMREGLSNVKPKLNLGELSKIYKNLKEGDCIAFRFKDLVFENKKEIERIIFTVN